ncbi:MAG TPA: TonB-dependent receptor [Cytophagales bacterium]|nr:TonB-dependent receptor [Cytophagales bacterium]
MKTTITLMVMGILSSLTMFAQNNKGKVSGEIVDPNNKPLAYSTVMLLKASDSSLVKGEVTNEEGKFALESIPYGKYILSSSLIGYQKYFSKEISLTESKPEIKLPGIRMSEETQNLKEVTIIGQKPFIEQKIDKTVVNVENSIVATGGTALEVLQRSPGVMVDNDDRISLRGKQGVIIMIDGKPSNLSAADAANMLRNMPSNSIEQIELITNPSAKYEAAGNAGIINIKLKKNKKAGMNGSVNAGTGYGRFEKYNAGADLNYRDSKFNLFANYNYSYNHRFGSNKFERRIGEGDTAIYFDQFNYRPMLFQNHSYKVGLDYYLNKNNTIGFMVNGFKTFGGLDVSNDTEIKMQPEELTPPYP